MIETVERVFKKLELLNKNVITSRRVADSDMFLMVGKEIKGIAFQPRIYVR